RRGFGCPGERSDRSGRISACDLGTVAGAAALRRPARRLGARADARATQNASPAAPPEARRGRRAPFPRRLGGAPKPAGRRGWYLLGVSEAERNDPTGGPATGDRFPLLPRADEHRQQPLLPAGREPAAPRFREDELAGAVGRALSDCELVVRHSRREDTRALHGPGTTRGDRDVKLDRL